MGTDRIDLRLDRALAIGKAQRLVGIEQRVRVQQASLAGEERNTGANGDVLDAIDAGEKRRIDRRVLVRGAHAIGRAGDVHLHHGALGRDLGVASVPHGGNRVLVKKILRGDEKVHRGGHMVLNGHLRVDELLQLDVVGLAGHGNMADRVRGNFNQTWRGLVAGADARGKAVLARTGHHTHGDGDVVGGEGVDDGF